MIYALVFYVIGFKILPLKLLIAFNAITILAAFRGNTGTDTLKFYEPFYEKYILYGSKYQGIEFGFYWLCKFGYALFNSFEGVLFTIATVIWFNFFYVIKYFKNLKINLVIYSIFLISFYMGPSMNIMRQLVATSFFLIAITKILEHKLWQYIVWIIVASLFHTSAIILLPIYFLYVDIENKKYKNFFFTLMICLLPVIFFLFFKVVINIPIFSKYKSIYGENLTYS